MGLCVYCTFCWPAQPMIVVILPVIVWWVVVNLHEYNIIAYVGVTWNISGSFQCSMVNSLLLGPLVCNHCKFFLPGCFQCGWRQAHFYICTMCCYNTANRRLLSCCTLCYVIAAKCISGKMCLSWPAVYISWQDEVNSACKNRSWKQAWGHAAGRENWYRC